jgi:hypothetical protein
MVLNEKNYYILNKCISLIYYHCPREETLPIQQLTVGMSDKILAIFMTPYVFYVHVYSRENRITEYAVTDSWRITEVRTGT